MVVTLTCLVCHLLRYSESNAYRTHISDHIARAVFYVPVLFPERTGDVSSTCLSIPSIHHCPACCGCPINAVKLRNGCSKPMCLSVPAILVITAWNRAYVTSYQVLKNRKFPTWIQLVIFCLRLYDFLCVVCWIHLTLILGAELPFGNLNAYGRHWQRARWWGQALRGERVARISSTFRPPEWPLWAQVVGSPGLPPGRSAGWNPGHREPVTNQQFPYVLNFKFIAKSVCNKHPVPFSIQSNIFLGTQALKLVMGVFHTHFLFLEEIHNLFFEDFVVAS